MSEDRQTRVLEVRDLRYRYDDGTVALDGVDFDLFEGETVALLGPNGAGKTTFVLHLNGLLRGSGSITVAGLKLGAETLTEVRQKVGIVFQESDDQLFMPTVLDDVAFGPLNMGLEPAEALARSRWALDTVGMAQAHGRAPYHLSAGEKRRVAIAGVLAMNPEILVLDEPTTSLDPPGQRALVDVLERLPQSKILVTHDPELACALARRAVFFDHGRIAASGKTDEILNRFGWRLRLGARSA